jgi:peroxiredoxin
MQWLVLALSGTAGYFVIWLRLGKFESIKKQVSGTIINALLIIGFIWRFSLVFFDPLKVFKNPMSILYFSGGMRGLVLSCVIAAVYLVYASIKQRIFIWRYLDFIISGILAGFTVYNIAALIVGRQFSLSSLGQSILAVLLLLWQLKKPDMYIFKKTLPAVMMAFLILWGVYDAVYKDYINNKNTGFNTPAANVDTGTIKEGIENGDLAPDFELTASDGRQVKLSHYRGKKVILNFWATWCPPCRAEIPDLEKFYLDFKDKDTVILGVDLTQSERSESAVADFIKKEGITYPVALDTENTVNQVYGVSSVPTSYMIDTKGIIRYKISGPTDYGTMKSKLADMY